MDWEVWRRCPYCVLPRSYVKNQAFMEHWVALNTDKAILLNNQEVLGYNIEDVIDTEFFPDKRPLYINSRRAVYYRESDKLDINHVIETRSGGSKDKVPPNRDTYNTYDGLKYGPAVDTGSIGKVATYISDEIFGPLRMFGDGTLWVEEYQDGNGPIGDVYFYDDSGQVESITTYDFNSKEIASRDV